MPETSTFNVLIALIKSELPILNNDMCDGTTYNWTSRYDDEDCSAFLGSLCHAVVVVAQHEGRYKGDYSITDLDRTRIQSEFEECLRDSITEPELDYTE